MDKYFSIIKEHKFLFIGVAGIIVLYFLFRGGSTGNSSNQSSITAQEEAAIAAAAQSNEQLAVAQDQVQVAGLQYAAAEAINGQNTTTQQYIANLEAGIATLNSNNSLSAIQNNNNTTLSLAQDSITAMNDAQDNAGQFEINNLPVAPVSTPLVTLGGVAFDPTFSQQYVGAV